MYLLRVYDSSSSSTNIYVTNTPQRRWEKYYNSHTNNIHSKLSRPHLSNLISNYFFQSSDDQFTSPPAWRCFHETRLWMEADSCFSTSTEIIQLIWPAPPTAQMDGVGKVVLTFSNVTRHVCQNSSLSRGKENEWTVNRIHLKGLMSENLQRQKYWSAAAAETGDCNIHVMFHWQTLLHLVHNEASIQFLQPAVRLLLEGKFSGNYNEGREIPVLFSFFQIQLKAKQANI